MVFQYREEAYKKDGDRPISGASRDKTGGNGFELKEERFHLDIKNESFMKTVVKHQNRFPREAVGASSVGTFDIKVRKALSS